MAKSEKENLNHTITFDYLPEDADELESCREKIEAAIKNGKKPSSKDLTQFYTILHKVSKQEFAERLVRLQKIKKEIVEFLSNNKKYIFKTNRTFIAEHFIKEEFEIEFSVLRFLDTLFALFKEDDTYYYPVTKKEVLIPYVYQQLSEYAIEGKIKISQYSKLVITGIIAAKFGYLPNEQDVKTSTGKYYTEYLYDSVKYLAVGKTKKD